MSGQAQILAAISGCNAQRPISVADLRSKTGLSTEVLHRDLDQLYDHRQICRCTVTRDGRTDEMIWPTGITHPISYGRHGVPLPPIPLRDVSIPAHRSTAELPAPLPSSTIIKEKDMEKSKTQIMLETLAEKGEVLSIDLCRLSTASSVKPFLGRYMERGEVLVKDTPNGKAYSLAPGFTPEQLIGNKYAALRAPETKPAAPAPVPILVPAPAALPEASPAIAEPVRPSVPTGFRVAITSDDTLMLMGLAQEVIELDAAQTRMLFSFLQEHRL